MVKLSKCAPSKRLSGEGRWFEWVNGARFKILPMSAQAFMERLTELREPYRKALATDDQSAEARAITTEIMRKASARLVVDVRGIEDDDGKPIEFTQPWIDATLADPSMAHLATFILTSAADQSAFTRAADLADEGN